MTRTSCPRCLSKKIKQIAKNKECGLDYYWVDFECKHCGNYFSAVEYDDEKVMVNAR